MPLSFILIALIGGAISLSRRVPEIQKRSEENYIGSADAPKLAPERVREELVFQIMQFVSAPLIAIVAYHVIGPETLATTTGLAFMSGFGSEAVLLMIRDISNGIKPLVLAAEKIGSLDMVTGQAPAARNPSSVDTQRAASEPGVAVEWRYTAPDRRARQSSAPPPQLI